MGTQSEIRQAEKTFKEGLRVLLRAALDAGIHPMRLWDLASDVNREVLSSQRPEDRDRP